MTRWEAIRNLVPSPCYNYDAENATYKVGKDIHCF